MPEKPLINAYLELSRKLPSYLKYSENWWIDEYHLHDDTVRVVVDTGRGERITLEDKQEEFPSTVLVGSIIMLL